MKIVIQSTRVIDGSFDYIIKTSGDVINQENASDGVIRVAYLGGQHPSGKQVGADTRTPNQKRAFIDLIARLKERFPEATITNCSIKKPFFDGR